MRLVSIVFPAILGSELILGCAPSTSCREEWILVEDDKLTSIHEQLLVLANGLIAGSHGTTATFELELSGPDEITVQLTDSGSVNTVADVYANGDRSDTFILVGDNALVRFSNDRGVSWSNSNILPFALTSDTQLSAVDFGCNDNGHQSPHGVVVGTKILLYTEDFGLTWTRSQISEVVAFSDVEIMHDGIALAVGERSIYRSIDFGKTWTIVYMTEDPTDQLLWVSSKECYIPFADPPHTVAAGGDLGGALLVSNDIGASWRKVPGPVSNMPLTQFMIISEEKSGLRSAQGIVDTELWSYHIEGSPLWTLEHDFNAPIRSVSWAQELFLSESGDLFLHSRPEGCIP